MAIDALGPSDNRPTSLQSETNELIGIDRSSGQADLPDNSDYDPTIDFTGKGVHIDFSA